MGNRIIIAGVDGCKAGWFAVWGDGGPDWEADVFTDVRTLWQRLEGAAMILIDIPIGLPSTGPRRCDVEARKRLGPPRASSVFPVPCREALSAGDRVEASVINQKVLGRKIGQQSWGICPKIRAVDELLRADQKARQVIREGHPEIAFCALAGHPMEYNKSEPEGIEERLAVLRRRWPPVNEVYAQATGRYLRKDVARDHAIDAAAMYVTACTPAVELGTIPAVAETDSAGLQMTMLCVR